MMRWRQISHAELHLTHPTLSLDLINNNKQFGSLISEFN